MQLRILEITDIMDLDTISRLCFAGTRLGHESRLNLQLGWHALAISSIGVGGGGAKDSEGEPVEEFHDGDRVEKAATTTATTSNPSQARTHSGGLIKSRDIESLDCPKWRSSASRKTKQQLYSSRHWLTLFSSTTETSPPYRPLPRPRQQW